MVTIATKEDIHDLMGSVPDNRKAQAKRLFEMFNKLEVDLYKITVTINGKEKVLIYVPQTEYVVDIFHDKLSMFMELHNPPTNPLFNHSYGLNEFISLMDPIAEENDLGIRFHPQASRIWYQSLNGIVDPVNLEYKDSYYLNSLLRSLIHKDECIIEDISPIVKKAYNDDRLLSKSDLASRKKLAVGDIIDMVEIRASVFCDCNFKCTSSLYYYDRMESYGKINVLAYDNNFVVKTSNTRLKEPNVLSNEDLETLLRIEHKTQFILFNNFWTHPYLCEFEGVCSFNKIETFQEHRVVWDIIAEDIDT